MKVKVKSLSHVQLFATPWTAAYQAPLPMGFSRQECWSGVPLPSPTLLVGRLWKLAAYMHACCVLCSVLFFATAWTVAHQASLSMGFSRLEYWSGVPLPISYKIPVHGYYYCLKLFSVKNKRGEDFILYPFFPSPTLFLSLCGSKFLTKVKHLLQGRSAGC